MDATDWFCICLVALMGLMTLFTVIEAAETRHLVLEVRRTNTILERIVP